MSLRLKVISILIGAIYSPLAVYIGFLFAWGRVYRALVFLGIEVILSLVDGVIFWKLIEGGRYAINKEGRKD